jgi:hypothetical protein
MKISVKNFILGFSVIVLLNVLSGCSRTALLDYVSDRDTKAFHKMTDSIFAAFDSGDKDGLKNLFSVNARDENPGLENQIEAFFNAYKGPMEIEEIRYSTSGGGHISHGKRRIEFYNSYNIIIKAGGVRYYVRIEMVSQDDFDKNNEGIQTLNIATEEAHNSKYFVYYTSSVHGGDDKPGLYYQDSTEKRDDIQWIEGGPHGYKYYDRKLAADDLLAVVEKDDDFNNFVSVIGEPNCRTVASYYYYELENGFFAVCKVEDEIHDIRPRVEGRVARPDVIVSIYIADEENNLETVWMADDIVKVLDSYHYFFPVDRELSEDFFKSFVLRSNSFSRLNEEIGAPNVDETWYCYYKISDNRYVECHYSGDNIRGFSVVDSEYRLYTIWEETPTD